MNDASSEAMKAMAEATSSAVAPLPNPWCRGRSALLPSASRGRARRIRKLQLNQALTPEDLEGLERIMVAAGVGTFEDIQRAKRESSGLGLFIRSLTGLDREAAKQEFGEFLSNRAASANQVEFVNMIIDHLTEHGVMDPGLLYESPFTDVSPRGPDALFTTVQVDKIVSILREIREHASVTE